MVFSPYRLFCFLLLKQAGIPTLQASFMYNETAATRKVSIHDSLRHKYTVFSTRICASNYFTSVKPFRKAATSTKSKAVQFPPILLDVYFLPTQTARLPQGVFSTRICTLNRSASVKPIRKAATSTKSKAVQFSPIPLDVYLFPTQTARLPHGVFSTRICASNRSANADTWEIIPTMQS